MNNFEKIKQMDIDELAEYSSIFQRCVYCSLGYLQKDGCLVVNMEECRKTTCKEAIKQWLLKEVQND